jgi:hypothetical protein
MRFYFCCKQEMHDGVSILILYILNKNNEELIKTMPRVLLKNGPVGEFKPHVD